MNSNDNPYDAPSSSSETNDESRARYVIVVSGFHGVLAVMLLRLAFYFFGKAFIVLSVLAWLDSSLATNRRLGIAFAIICLGDLLISRLEFSDPGIKWLSAITIVLSDERQFDAELVGSDAAMDLAVLKIEASGVTPPTLGSFESPSSASRTTWLLLRISPSSLISTPLPKPRSWGDHLQEPEIERSDQTHRLRRTREVALGALEC